MPLTRQERLDKMKKEYSENGRLRSAGEKLIEAKYEWDGQAWVKDGKRVLKADGSFVGGVSQREIDSKTWFLVRAEQRRQFNSTDEGRLALRESWEQRKEAAKKKAKEIEVGMIEELTRKEVGQEQPTVLMAKAIATASVEISKRIVEGAKTLKSNDLILLSNTLMGLTKNLLSLRDKADEKSPTTAIQVNIKNESGSKTGGAVGSILDVKPVNSSISELIGNIKD